MTQSWVSTATSRPSSTPSSRCRARRFRWAVGEISKVCDPGARRRRHHRRRPRRVRPAPGQHAHHRRDGPPQTARARGRRPRHRDRGNTSAASVPLALDRLLESGELPHRRARAARRLRPAWRTPPRSSSSPNSRPRARAHDRTTVPHRPEHQGERVPGDPRGPRLDRERGRRYPVADITPEKAFVDDLDIDSLSMVEVVMAAEGQVRREHPGRRGQEPQDRRRRGGLHIETLA